MSRYVTLAVVLCACIGIAYAGAHKIMSFTPVNGEAPEADGMAILNYVDGGSSGNHRTIIQLILSDFTPNTTYDWVLDSPTAGAWAGGDEFTTDDKGHATFHTELPVDVSDADIEIGIDADGNGIFEGTELRAYGTQS